MQPSSSLNNMASASLLGFTYVRFYSEVQPEILSTVGLCQRSVGVYAERTTTQCHSPVRVKSPHTLPESERSNKKTHTSGENPDWKAAAPSPTTTTPQHRDWTTTCRLSSSQSGGHCSQADGRKHSHYYHGCYAPFGAANSDSVLLLMLLQPETTTVTMMRVQPAAAAGGPQAGVDVWLSLV